MLSREGGLLGFVKKMRKVGGMYFLSIELSVSTVTSLGLFQRCFLSKKVDMRDQRDGSGVRASAALIENPSSVPSPHIEQLITTCKFSSRGSGNLFWPLREPAFMCSYFVTHN